MSQKWVDNIAIQNFREYLRIPSVHPDINYDSCIEFLTKMAKGLALDIHVYEVMDKKPVVVITWIGQDPSLPAIMLNSHMDVVPVYENSWDYPPFSAHITDDGKIYARGTQDMKSVGIQYLEAIRKLINSNITLRRTLHVIFVPDEEIGGKAGMKLFVQTDYFKALNIGFAMDEGRADPSDTYVYNICERTQWQLTVRCPIADCDIKSHVHGKSAGEKIRHVMNHFLDFRHTQKSILDNDPKLPQGAVTSVNLTKCHGKIFNGKEDELTLTFDMRITPSQDLKEFEDMVHGWLKEAGDNVYYTNINKAFNNYVSPVTEPTNPYVQTLLSTFSQLNLKVSPSVCEGATDMRYVRAVGIPAVGFSPMANTPILLHAHNEYIHADIFLQGIDIYVAILKNIANME